LVLATWSPFDSTATRDASTASVREISQPLKV